MDQAQEVLDLSITLTQAPLAAPPDAIASIALACGALDLSHPGNLLTDPLTRRERSDLRWYLEEYWKWPYLGFAERGRRVEASLHDIGKRLYHAIFSSPGAEALMGQWQRNAAVLHQISILSELPSVLSLPWELLHDGQGFLALHPNHPIAIVRRLPHREQPAFSTPFELPLRILLISARPEGAGFIDPRSIARELVDELQKHVESGTVEIEFLRPPTFAALRARLIDTKCPIHVLHFDGHGEFDEQRERQGILLFETEAGKPASVKASDLATVLHATGIQLAVLTSCQSAIGAVDDAFSSVAAQLIRGGVNAVIAMSSSILVISAARYVEAFYHAIAEGLPVSIAHEQAGLALQKDPYRHPFHRHQDEEATRVKLSDWWVPHFYQQSPVLFQLVPTNSANRPPLQMPPVRLLSNEMPAEPRYGFSGRAHELRQIERHLLQGKIVVLHGFGGIGKTALAWEAADWLTRTGMYQGACFVSFEGGRESVRSLLSRLGFFLGVYDGTYTPDDPKKALEQLQAALKQQRTLVIADNLESILPGGEATLDASERTEFWNVLFGLQGLGTGVLLTTRTTAFGDGRLSEGAQVVYLQLGGLARDDAYQLATSLLTSLQIDRRRAPYLPLQELLQQLGYHPLSIQLVLLALRTYSLAQIQQDFAALLSQFTDNTETGHNRSLLASLDYSLHRLSDAQRTLLSRLALFEGGTSEVNLLMITEIAETEWMKLRLALEQAALLTVEQVRGVPVPFLHFHPLLAPYLRSQPGAGDPALCERYTGCYYGMAQNLHQEDLRRPQAVRALVQKELPNLRRALELTLEMNKLDAASTMADCIVWFLNYFGLLRECDTLRRRLDEAVEKSRQERGGLTYAEYLHESGLGERELQQGNLRAARTRFTTLLARIETQLERTSFGLGSYGHCMTLARLARCLRSSGQPEDAELLQREALIRIDDLIRQQPEGQDEIRARGLLLGELADALVDQGKYTEAREAYERALKIAHQQNDLRQQAIGLGQLGNLAIRQRDYAEAQSCHLQAFKHFRTLDEPAMQAVSWQQLGIIAGDQGEWAEAERCFRESLAINEQLGLADGAAMICNHLANVARLSGRPVEAEWWYKRALELDEQVHPGSLDPYCLTNLSALLVSEVRTGLAPKTRLAEAKAYAKQALAIREALDASSAIWMTLGVLAAIADLEGQAEEVRDYRRRELESFAAFPGNRSRVDQEYGQMIAVTAAAAIGVEEAQKKLVASLPELTAAGYPIAPAIERILAGERDWFSLAEDVGRTDVGLTMALLLLRVLETLEELTEASARTPEQSIASLPIVIRESLSSTYCNQGAAYYAQGEYERAIADYNEALRLQPDFANAYYNRGLAYTQLGEYQQAIADFNEAQRLRPDSAGVYRNRGHIYYKQGEYERAIADYNEALRLQPDSANAYLMRGYAYLYLKGIEEARADFQRAAERVPDDVNMHWMVVFASLKRVRPGREMADHLERIAAIDENTHYASTCRAVALGLRGNVKDGLRKLEQVLLKDPTSQDSLFWKGVLSAYDYDTTRPEVAIEAIEKALENGLPPVLLTPLYWLQEEKPRFFEEYAQPILEWYGV